MLVKPRKDLPKAEEKPKTVVKSTRVSKNKCVCNKCHKTQTYLEVKIPIQYGFNTKKSVQIEGIERVCSVCGWHVDDIETTRINSEIAKSML